ncbi:DUF1871 family protein [Paenibacillus kandeliae]|uniref:DUF1871 family protein n=1 Tax=Paenibacillus kandeliae TaxID=3231269 RepID=UPI00345808A0
MNIKQIIDDWDPIELFPYAPDDEYEVEIKLIENYLCSHDKLNEDHIAREIVHVFRTRFGNIFTASEMTCLQIARTILNSCR